MPSTKIQLLIISLILLATFVWSFSSLVYADIGIKQPKINSGIQVGGKTADSLIGGIIGNAITLIFTIASVSAVAVFLWGSVDWIFSGGDKEKVGKARQKITYALGGLILISVSFLILSLIGLYIGINPLKDLKIPFLGDNIAGSAQSVPKK